MFSDIQKNEKVLRKVFLLRKMVKLSEKLAINLSEEEGSGGQESTEVQRRWNCHLNGHHAQGHVTKQGRAQWRHPVVCSPKEFRLNNLFLVYLTTLSVTHVIYCRMIGWQRIKKWKECERKKFSCDNYLEGRKETTETNSVKSMIRLRFGHRAPRIEVRA